MHPTTPDLADAAAALAEVPTFPARVSADYPTQRWFDAGSGHTDVQARSQSAYAGAQVYRQARDDLAEVRIRVHSFGEAYEVAAGLSLGPAGLRALAQRLLDAAADIEQHPASSLRAA